MSEPSASTSRYKCHCVHAKEIRQLHGHGNCLLGWTLLSAQLTDSV